MPASKSRRFSVGKRELLTACPGRGDVTGVAPDGVGRKCWSGAGGVLSGSLWEAAVLRATLRGASAKL